MPHPDLRLVLVVAVAVGAETHGIVVMLKLFSQLPVQYRHQGNLPDRMHSLVLGWD